MAYDELTDELRGPVAALLGVKPEEIAEIRPVAYSVKVTQKVRSDGPVGRGTYNSSAGYHSYHHIELS